MGSIRLIDTLSRTSSPRPGIRLRRPCCELLRCSAVRSQQHRDSVVPGRESSAILIIMVNGTEMNMPIGPSTQLQNTGDRNTTGADKSTPRPTRVLVDVRRGRRSPEGNVESRLRAGSMGHGAWGTAIRHENQFWIFRSAN